MNQPYDPNQQPDEEQAYGQDYYAEDQAQGYEEEPGQDYADDQGYDDNQLPVRDERTFFQKYANVIIFGGIGIFILVMGYLNFGHLFFGKTQVAAPEQAPVAATEQSAAPGDTVIPPPAATTEAAQGVPSMDAMGVSPAAPVIASPDSGLAPSPVAPADPNDPWADVAAAPPAAPSDAVVPPAATVPEVQTPAPSVAPSNTTAAASPAVPAVDTQARAAEAAKLVEAERKLAEVEALRREQESTIAELQNKLAEAEVRANAAARAPAVAAAPEPTVAEPAPAPKPKAVKRAAKPKVQADKNSWELRAASEGSAWISRPGDNQLYRVAVGDEVPELGRVTAIREQDGRWTIVGTRGMIRQ
jgi:hypothetical protein